MKILEKIKAKTENLMEEHIPCIAFLGDSVTQGCFELYEPVEGKPLETVCDFDNNYQNNLKKLLNMFYPNTPVALINAGISGDNAVHGAKRIEKDVLRFNPDLVVVSFGLNDCHKGIEGVKEYSEALATIFNGIKDSGAECIFMTENMMNTYVSDRIKNDFLKEIAQKTMAIENEGVLKEYFDAAKAVALEYDIAVCDVYSKWKQLEESGIDTTSLLSNNINHPVRQMHQMFAYMLFETMLNN